MMTNRPEASIGETMNIPFLRPRDRVQIMEDYGLALLYNRFAHEEAS